MSVFSRLGRFVEDNQDSLPDWVREPETIWLVFLLGFALGAIIL